MQIPKFRASYPTEDIMSTEQKSFYELVQLSLSKGEYIELDGNVSYAFIYLYELLSGWKKRGFENLSEFLIHISELYRHERVLSSYCLHWAYDCLLGLEKFEEYLEKTEPKTILGTSTHASNTRLNVQERLGLPANPIDILLITGKRKTKLTVENQTLFKDKIIICFNKYAVEHQDWFTYFNSWLSEKALYQHGLFGGAPFADKPYLQFKSYHSAYEHLDIVKNLARDAENLARESLGLPRIGEGWVSETELFRKLETEFSSTKVIQHGRPTWLGRQHFDIWIPNWRIAVEYHGKQHFEPVEFFGGEETFKETVKRDKRKVDLAKRHNVKLLIVTEADSIDELIQTIRNLRSQRKVPLLPA